MRNTALAVCIALLCGCLKYEPVAPKQCYKYVRIQKHNMQPYHRDPTQDRQNVYTDTSASFTACDAETTYYDFFYLQQEVYYHYQLPDTFYVDSTEIYFIRKP